MGWYPFLKPGLPILQACTEDKDPEVGHCRGKMVSAHGMLKTKPKAKGWKAKKTKNPTKETKHKYTTT